MGSSPLFSRLPSTSLLVSIHIGAPLPLSLPFAQLGIEEGRRLGGSPLFLGLTSLRLAGPHSWDMLRPLLQPMTQLQSLWLEQLQLPFPSRWVPSGIRFQFDPSISLFQLGEKGGKRSSRSQYPGSHFLNIMIWLKLAQSTGGTTPRPTPRSLISSRRS